MKHVTQFIIIHDTHAQHVFTTLHGLDMKSASAYLVSDHLIVMKD